MQASSKTTFTNLQQELLKLYARQVSDEDLKNIRELIGAYFAGRLTSLADAAWDKNRWTQQDIRYFERIQPTFPALLRKDYDLFVTNEILKSIS
jgi:hypothetical protein